jgi:heme-degrading monooxygenase HmoA
MAVMVTYKPEGISEQAYAGMLSALSQKQRGAPGFRLHAGVVEGGSLQTVTEVWDSEEDSRRWFDENVKPNLPAGAPTGTYQQLHSVVTP